MKKIIGILVLLFCNTFLFAQSIDKIITVNEVERIEKILSADDMQGRKVFTPGIDKAAAFIASEFEKNNLTFYGNNKSYFQEFSMVKSKPIVINGMIDTDSLNAFNVAANTTAIELSINSLNDYVLVTVNKDEDFFKKVFPLFDTEKNLLVLVDTAHAKKFKSMQRFAGNAKFISAVSQIFILTANLHPATFTLHIKSEQSEQKLKNVVAVLPGKNMHKKDEFVIFSGHYDHLGIGKPNKDQDSIYNGANDDAAGITAVIMLSKYFSTIKDNERTLVFVAFTAEESGGFGSRYFSKHINGDKVSALFNIEMIGTESKWGTNSAYITGFDKSDFGKILQNNLAGSDFHFEPDPYPDQNLFYRSDNATLAEQGVPAHTISTSKMDAEKFYHTQEDEIEMLDMNNMAAIIKAIAISSKTIVNGTDSPTRIEKKN